MQILVLLDMHTLNINTKRAGSQVQKQGILVPFRRNCCELGVNMHHIGLYDDDLKYNMCVCACMHVCEDLRNQSNEPIITDGLK